MRRHLLSLALLATILPGCSYFKKGPPMKTGFVTHEYASPAYKETRSYGMYVPEDYNETRRKKYPLILFLHGYGESGSDVNLVVKHGPLKVAMANHDNRFLMIAPQSPKLEGPKIREAWYPILDADIALMLAEVKKDYRVDESRIYLTGLSMGGYGSFALAAAHPGMFAAVAPICGGGDAGKAGAYKGTPFWIFHGRKDSVVPVNRSIEMYDTMKALSCEVQITLYPDANHDSWTATYANPDLYSWMLEHQLSRK